MEKREGRKQKYHKKRWIQYKYWYNIIIFYITQCEIRKQGAIQIWKKVYLMPCHIRFYKKNMTHLFKYTFSNERHLLSRGGEDRNRRRVGRGVPSRLWRAGNEGRLAFCSESVSAYTKYIIFFVLLFLSQSLDSMRESCFNKTQKIWQQHY